MQAIESHIKLDAQLHQSDKSRSAHTGSEELSLWASPGVCWGPVSLGDTRRSAVTTHTHRGRVPLPSDCTLLMRSSSWDRIPPAGGSHSKRLSQGRRLRNPGSRWQPAGCLVQTPFLLFKQSAFSPHPHTRSLPWCHLEGGGATPG